MMMHAVIIYGALTEVKGFVNFTAIVPTTTADSDSVVCVVEDVEGVACILGSNIT